MGKRFDHTKPVIGATEPRDAHCKVYAEKSVKAAIQQFADYHGMTFSEAGRQLWLTAFEQVYGGYEIR